MYKYLAINQSWAPDFDFVIVLDSDVCMMSWAPPIHPMLLGLGDGIGMVNEYAQPTGRYEDRVAVQRSQGWEDSPKKYYAMYTGLDLDNRVVLQGGFMVFQPAKHRAIAEEIFLRHAERSAKASSMHYEQAVTGYELFTRKLWACIPSVWNAVWYMQDALPGNTVKLDDFLRRNYFVHFSGGYISRGYVADAIHREYNEHRAEYLRENETFSYGCEWLE